MEKESARYQFMGICVNSIMNGITNSGVEYQEIILKSEEYSGRLGQMGLLGEVRLLIDCYVSEQNALGSGIECLPICPTFLTVKRCFGGHACSQSLNRCPKEDTVHFLNQVGEADLMALVEDRETRAKPPAVISTHCKGCPYNREPSCEGYCIKKLSKKWDNF